MANATLVTITQDSSGNWQTPGDSVTIPVQFNPHTLTIAYSNNVVTTPSSKPKVPPQKVSTPSSKLTLELLFDTSEAGTDVTTITSQLAQIAAPGNTGAGSTPAGGSDPAPANAGGVEDPKGISFRWNSFIFNGTLDSMSETLDYFGETGIPLRSTVSMSLTSHDFTKKSSSPQGANGVSPPGSSGTTPMAAAQVGASLQGMAGSIGASASWKSIASANGIDNPLRLTAGASINLNARITVGS